MPVMSNPRFVHDVVHVKNMVCGRCINVVDRLFREAGMSPYLIFQKIDKVEEWLAYGELRLSEIGGK